MLEGLQQLIELQLVDDELVLLEQEQAGLPARRERVAAGRASCDAKLTAAKEGVQGAEAAQRDAERDLQDKEALLEKLEGQQFQVKSNEAYTALLSEMDQARQAISDCETRILESMEAIESARTAFAASEEELAVTRSSLDADEHAIDQRDTELSARIPELRELRDERKKGIEAELISLYDKIVARRRPAVVRITRESCTGCRVDIPPQNYIEILRGERLITCGNCQRILVHEGDPNAAAC